MNNSELNSILKRASTPRKPNEFWEDFPQQVVRQLNRPLRGDSRPRGGKFPGFAWAFATAVCVLVAFFIGHWRGQQSPAADLLANAKLVHDTLAMFPNQVRAIVEDPQGLHLMLSDSGNVPSSTPLYVRICDGKNCSSLVTFSGQEIQIAGQKMTVLADTQGGIILLGNNFVWSSEEKTYPDTGLKIEAKSLTLAAL